MPPEGTTRARILPGCPSLNLPVRYKLSNSRAPPLSAGLGEKSSARQTVHRYKKYMFKQMRSIRQAGKKLTAGTPRYRLTAISCNDPSQEQVGSRGPNPGRRTTATTPKLFVTPLIPFCQVMRCPPCGLSHSEEKEQRSSRKTAHAKRWYDGDQSIQQGLCFALVFKDESDVTFVLQIDKALTNNNLNTEVLKTFQRSPHYIINEGVEQERSGDPCRTPLLVGKLLKSSPYTLTCPEVYQYRDRIMFTDFWGIPKDGASGWSANLLVRDSNPTSASRLPLSRFGQPGSISALVLPSGGMAARHRKGVTAERGIPPLTDRQNRTHSRSRGIPRLWAVCTNGIALTPDGQRCSPSPRPSQPTSVPPLFKLLIIRHLEDLYAPSQRPIAGMTILAVMRPADLYNKSFSCSTLSVPSCHATRRKHEGWDTARLPAWVCERH
ncbi:hypothetical protein CSKR_112622 [Clonorchis sinensis]|uniref:Uncharacterized protein n=1 Tax=Clonorchis sinensis TaxID=79923 RepID=A0A419PEQ8_CLOSI|nr:hypothetical protein CSKR_112622 [Clonorchis sinensis]